MTVRYDERKRWCNDIMSEQEDVKFDMLMIGIYIDNGLTGSILSN